jgi:hypothetical protein
MLVVVVFEAHGNAGVPPPLQMEKALLVDRKFKQALRLFEQANTVGRAGVGRLGTVAALAWSSWPRLGRDGERVFAQQAGKEERRSMWG